MNKEKFRNYLYNEIDKGSKYIVKLKNSEDLFDIEFVGKVKFQQEYLFLLIDMINAGIFD